MRRGWLAVVRHCGEGGAQERARACAGRWANARERTARAKRRLVGDGGAEGVAPLCGGAQTKGMAVRAHPNQYGSRCSSSNSVSSTKHKVEKMMTTKMPTLTTVLSSIKIHICSLRVSIR